MSSCRPVVQRSATTRITRGGLNATPWSSAYKRLADGAGLVRVGHPATATWPASPRPLIAIDHILVRGVRSGSLRLGTPVGSDHLPLIAELRFSH
jgi:endonuclease/exonuclease/phosphatase (EEP) superfamily protein YafD